MARTKGAKNAKHAQQRLELARRVRARVLQDDGVRASLSELATAGGVSVPTLKHYFHDRAGVLSAVMESLHQDAAPYLAMSALPSTSEVRPSLETFFARFLEAWHQFGVGEVQAKSLATALSARYAGPAYVNGVLEPLLQSAESLLRTHVERGELASCNVRFAALELLSPVVLALLHQDSLGGSGCRPLDLSEFLQTHLDAFLKAHPPT